MVTTEGNDLAATPVTQVTESVLLTTTGAGWVATKKPATPALPPNSPPTIAPITKAELAVSGLRSRFFAGAGAGVPDVSDWKKNCRLTSGALVFETIGSVNSGAFRDSYMIQTITRQPE